VVVGATTRVAMATLPPLIHLPTAGLAALSLDAPTDPTGAKRDRAGNELEDQDALSVDAIIDRFVVEFGKALKTVKAVAEAGEQTTDAMRVEAAVKVITDELDALRAERNQLYNGDDVRDVIKRFAKSGGHKAILANYEYIAEQGKRYKNKEIELTKEQRQQMAQNYKAYKSFIDSGRHSRLKDIEGRLANALPPEELAEHAKAAIKILSVQPHQTKEEKQQVIYYSTWFEAFRLFDAVDTHAVVEKSSFAVWVLNNPGECGGQVLGSNWLQDLRFQRVLLQLGEEATNATHSHEKQTLSMRWKLKCYQWLNPSEEGPLAYAYDEDVGVRTASFLVSVETAARRVRRWMGAQKVASKPASGDPEVGLLGWDFALNLDAPSNRWAWERLEAIAAMGGEEPLEKMGARFARRTARRLLMGKHTRKLARIGTSIADEPGTDGADSKSERIEFGLDGTTCPNVDDVLKFIAMPPVGSMSSVDGNDPMRMLYPLLIRLSTVTDSINLEDKRRLLEFHDDSSKEVALVSWGSRTRVLFKLHSRIIRVPFPAIERTDFKLVDPLGKKAPIPKVLREAFAPGEGTWMERAAEDASEGSCFLSAVMRAMVIAHAASQPNSINQDVYRAAEASPSEGVAPVCAAVATLARSMFADDKYARSEVFRTPLPTMQEVREAMEGAVTEDMLFDPDTDDDDTQIGHQCVLDPRLAVMLPVEA